MKLPWLRRGEPPARWLMVDVESSGLDPTRDRLLAIAAAALRPSAEHLLLDPADSFEVVIRQPEVPLDKANILVHGIGVGSQRSGTEPAAALQAFCGFVAGSPLIGFHAAFDRTLIERALRAFTSCRLPGPWLDLAELAPVLRPELRARALDEWLAACSVSVGTRHQAASDVWATAELMQKLWPLARRQGASSDFRTLLRLAAARRWL